MSMYRSRFWALALACASFVSNLNAGTFTENFATNPATRGWQVFGNSNLFEWDSTNQNLHVKWDSTQSNSYFYRPLGTILAKEDDFQVSFDMKVSDAAVANSNKIYPLPVIVGFMNHADATSPGFVRGAFQQAKNLVEFNYYPEFDDPFFGHFADSVAPVMLSSTYGFDGAFNYLFTMTNDVSYHVVMSYTASNHTLTTVVTLTGETTPLTTPIAVLTGSNDFRVDTISISSYTDIGDDFNSLIANGTIANLTVTTPPPPVQNFSGSLVSNVWQAEFTSNTNWLYTLERSGDLQSWAPASSTTNGNGTTMALQDTNTPGTQAFYRVRANRQ